MERLIRCLKFYGVGMYVIYELNYKMSWQAIIFMIHLIYRGIVMSICRREGNIGDVEWTKIALHGNKNSKIRSTHK